MPGAARQQVTLFCLPKIQVTKQKGTPPRRPYGLPSVFRKDRAAAELALCAQTVLADGPRFFRKTEAAQRGIWVLWAEPVFWVPSPPGRAGWGGLVFVLSVPLIRHRVAQPRRGGFCEDCLSAQREFRSSPAWRATQGTPQGRWIGAAFFGSFLWPFKERNQPAGLPPAPKTSAKHSKR
jgi:hypothetical protein